MRRVEKFENSEILTRGLSYQTGNSSANKKIAEVLKKEQKGFCAYTDEFISRTDAADVEHFNPSLKGSSADNYDNWVLAKHQWNKEKGRKWTKYQPILVPTSIDFEKRIVYLSGDYGASTGDIEAHNLIKLLKLDDPALADNRKRCIRRWRYQMELLGENPNRYFQRLIEMESISYPRAIQEEFQIDIWAMFG